MSLYIAAKLSAVYAYRRITAVLSALKAVSGASGGEGSEQGRGFILRLVTCTFPDHDIVDVSALSAAGLERDSAAGL